MSASNKDDDSSEMPARVPMQADAMLSDSIADLLLPGVVVELDADEADALGAFEETALTEIEARESNAYLDADEAADGR
jgi:hypothetical protein